MRRLEKKVAIVAGAGGIGTATARRLAEEGCAVLLGQRPGYGSGRPSGRRRPL